MLSYKYGTFTDNQIKHVKQCMQRQIIFLLVCVDEKTKKDYVNIDVDEAFTNLLTWFDGLNELLFCPAELVKAIALLEEARKEYAKESFDFNRYRKIILDANGEVMRIKEND